VSLSLGQKKSQDAVPSAEYDAIVLGAGPYGLSVSAHLHGYGLRVATFGKPIHFWRNHMPDGMLLRSYWWATGLSDPEKKYTISRYLAEQGIAAVDPLPAITFINYGLWFQQHAVPNVDETYISQIEHQGNRYQVTLEDGRVLYSKGVVLAPGLHYYLYMPDEYTHLPPSLVSHSSAHRDVREFSGRKVVFIGGGQGSLETAALMSEQDTDVVVIARRDVSWLTKPDESKPALLRNLNSPQAGMGDGWKNLLLEKYPYVLQRFPQSKIDDLVDTMHGPAGAHWLKPRILNGVTLMEGVHVAKSETIQGERVALTLSNGETLEADHIILGTGYHANVKGLPMLSDNLKDSLQSYRGSPVLNNCFESNIPGLFFVGFSSARSFGPFYRFVVGTDAAARRVAGHMARFVAHSVAH
jgi:cation diffusion facilitator CzcD-associated flavoprotein CzcO